MLHSKTLGRLVCLGISCLFLVAGCEKDQESTAPTMGDLTGTIDDAAKDADTQAPEIEKAVEQAEAVVTDLKTDTGKALSEIKEQVQAMTLEDLKAMAVKYKDAIMSQEGEVNTLMEKVKAMPLAEQLGDEAKQLQDDIAKLTKAIKPLKQRYDIYLGKLKELKADIGSLELK